MKKWTRERVRHICKKALQLIFNPRFLLCFGIGWMITNGWSYVMLTLGTWLHVPWMIAVASGYLALLWIPFTPEKLITTAIAIALLRWLFPKDEKTLGMLRTLHQSAKAKWHEYLARWREKKNQKSNHTPEC